jgi:hypothetical protein
MAFTPPELTIASPDDSIAALTRWSLGTISLGSITFEDLVSGRDVAVVLPPGYINVSEYSSVMLRFDDSDYGVMQLSVPSSNFTVINTPDGYNATPLNRRIPITVIGPQEVIGAMTVADIEGTINLAGVPDVAPGTRFVSGTFTVAGTEVTAWVVGSTYDVEVVVTRD